MKIGYFTTKFPYSQSFKEYSYGGSILAAYYLASEMKNRGHEIDVFTTSVNSKNSIEKHENVRVYHYGTNFRMLSSNISFDLLVKPVKYNVDIAHEHFDIPHGPFAGLRYAKKKNVPLVVTYHGDWVASYGGLVRRMGIAVHNKYLVDRLLSYADVIISPSKYYINGSRFLRKYRDKIVVIPNGINLSDFDMPYSKEECKRKFGLIGKNVVLFVGTLYPLKGPDILLNAIPKVIKEHKDTIFVFAGGGNVDEYKRLSEELCIQNYVRFEGYVDEEKLYYYRAADVFVLPSYGEMFPLVLLEASASGLPMVVSDLNTLKCIVEDGYNGLFTKRGHENDIAEKIVYLLENKEVREKMGKNARKNVEDYSWVKIAEETEKVYSELIGK